MMDIQTGLVCLGIAFLSAIVIFFISMFGMKEKTYEEAIAEQRKLSEEHLLIGRTVKDKTKDKKQKKAGKKVKEKPIEREKMDQASSVPKIPKKMNVFEEPEAAVARDTHSQEDKKSKKKEKVMQIGVGKQQQHEKPVASHFEDNRSNDAPLLAKQKDNKEKLNAKVAAARLKEIGSGQEPPKVGASNKKDKGTSPKLEKAAAPKTEKATSSKAEKVTAPKVDKVTAPKVEKIVAPKVEKMVIPKMEKVNTSKVEKVAAPKLEKISTPKVEKVVNPKVEKASSPKMEKGASLKGEKISAPKAEKITAPKGEKATAPKGEKATAPKGEKIAAPKGEKATASKVEKVASPKVEKVVAPKVEKVVAAKVEKVAKPEKPLASAPNTDQGMSVATLVTKEKSKKKKKSDLATLQQMSVNRDGVNVSLLVPLVHKAELSRSEIQILIDLLLNKQQGSSVDNSEWIEGRQDPVAKLRKQLSDKERSLTEEQEASQAMQSKLRELRTQLNSERSRQTLATRTMEEALAGRQQELSVLTAKLQQSVDSHCAEKQALTQQLQVQAKLSEDHLTLQQELVSQRQQLEYHLEAEVGYKAQVGQLHLQLNEQSMDNVRLIEQVARLEAQVRHLDEVSGQAQDLTRQLEEVQRISQQHDAELQYQLGALQDQLEAAGVHLASKGAALFSAEVEARQLREENESLAAQVTAVTERPAAEGRENGETYPEPIDKPENGIVKQQELQLEQQSLDLKQKDCLIDKLNSDINTYKTEISKVNQELEAQKSRNDNLQSKNWKVMDALSATEKSLETNLKESPKLVSEAAQKAHVDEQTAIKQVLLRIFPDINNDEKEYSTWLGRFEGSACSLVAELRNRPEQEDCDHALEELQEQNTMLKARVTHYKVIIDDTEGILNRLQGHVEQEEQRWRQQLLLKDAQLEAMTEETARLELALGQGNLQDQLKELEDKLQAEEAEKQDLDLKYKELLCTSRQVENSNEEHLALRKEVARLKGLVQNEHQSLEAEQPHSQLQQQLNNVDQNHSVATNGPVAEPSLTETGSARK